MQYQLARSRYAPFYNPKIAEAVARAYCYNEQLLVVFEFSTQVFRARREEDKGGLHSVAPLSRFAGSPPPHIPPPPPLPSPSCPPLILLKLKGS